MANNDLFNRILPDCYLYISHLDEDYQYWILPGYPDEISDNHNSTFMDNSALGRSALGRSAPVYTFSSSGPRTVQITLSFHRDMFEDINKFLYLHVIRPLQQQLYRFPFALLTIFFEFIVFFIITLTNFFIFRSIVFSFDIFFLARVLFRTFPLNRLLKQK